MDMSIQIMNCNFGKYIIGFLFIRHKSLIFCPFVFFPFVHSSKWSNDTCVWEIYDKHKKVRKNLKSILLSLGQISSSQRKCVKVGKTTAVTTNHNMRPGVQDHVLALLFFWVIIFSVSLTFWIWVHFFIFSILWIYNLCLSYVYVVWGKKHLIPDLINL